MMEINDKLVSEMREWLRDYINHTCIYRVKPNERPLIGKASGSFYTWQLYLRRGLFNSKFLNFVAISFWYEFAELYKEKPFQITGLETGATPMLPALAMTSKLFDIDVNVFSTRAERKKYGLHNRFEGIIDYSLPVVLVDDLCNSKSTIIRCKKYVEDEGLKLYDYGFAILNKDVDKEHPDHDKYIGPDYKIKSIFNLSDFNMTWNEYSGANDVSLATPFIRENNGVHYR